MTITLGPRKDSLRFSLYLTQICFCREENSSLFSRYEENFRNGGKHPSISPQLLQLLLFWTCKWLYSESYPTKKKITLNFPFYYSYYCSGLGSHCIASPIQSVTMYSCVFICTRVHLWSSNSCYAAGSKKSGLLSG
jgi:hypothetical protein